LRALRLGPSAAKLSMQSLAARPINHSLTKSAKPVRKRRTGPLEAEPAHSQRRTPVHVHSWPDCLSIRPCAGKMRKNRDCRITESEADEDGTAASSSRIFTSTRSARSRPEPLCSPSRTGATIGLEPSGSGARVLARRPRRSAPACRLRRSTTSRDGVAHEAPLSTVWRVFESARQRNEPHAST